MSILIIGKKGGKSEVIDEAKNKDEAKGQVNYWKKLRPGWKITSKPYKK